MLKCVKAAAKDKLIRRGVKEVVKALKKGEQGLAVIAGDISPIEVIAHVPILCEEKNVAYIYVPAKEELGLASLTKRPTSIVMVRHGAEFADAYSECEKEMRKVRHVSLKRQTRSCGAYSTCRLLCVSQALPKF